MESEKAGRGNWNECNETGCILLNFICETLTIILNLVINFLLSIFPAVDTVLSQASNSIPTQYLVAVIVSVIVVLLFIGVVVVFCCCRKRNLKVVKKNYEMDNGNTSG